MLLCDTAPVAWYYANQVHGVEQFEGCGFHVLASGAATQRVVGFAAPQFVMAAYALPPKRNARVHAMQHSTVLLWALHGATLVMYMLIVRQWTGELQHTNTLAPCAVLDWS